MSFEEFLENLQFITWTDYPNNKTTYQAIFKINTKHVVDSIDHCAFITKDGKESMSDSMKQRLARKLYNQLKHEFNNQN